MTSPQAPHPPLDAMGDDFGAIIARQFATICAAVLRGPGVTSLRDFTRIITQQPHPFANFAIFSNPTELAVRLAVEPLAELSVPAALVFAASPVDRAIVHVKASGFALAHAMPAMAVDIDTLPTQELAAGYTFEEVHASADGAWCDAFAAGYEIPRPVAQVFGPAAAAASASKDALRYFAVRKDGAIVTTSLVYLDGGLAGIYCVSTIPSERRKGLGTYATAEPLRRARELGYRTGILQSSEMGEGVYRGLGFKTFGSLPLYVRMPG
jgi:hypothetical protein